MKLANNEKIIGGLLDGLKKNSFKTGLVLSGGAVKGFAHAGAIKALEENNVVPDIVSGVSAGSIVGGFYCDGFTPEETFEIFEKNKIFELVKVRFKKQGLLTTSGFRKVLKNNLRTKRIEDLHKPLVITATNIEEGITTYFTEGDLVDAIVASCSIPVLFTPVKIGGITYVDGGVTNNFPVEPIEAFCKKLIGIHINPQGPFNPEKGIIHLAMNAFHLSIASELGKKIEKLELFIEPKELAKYNYYDLKFGGEMFDIGYNVASKIIKSSKN